MAVAPVQIILDHKIRSPLKALPNDVRRDVLEALTIPNIAKLNAKKQHQWGWERMPDNIELYEIVGQDLVMPRGFLVPFVEGLMLYGYDYELTDNRTWEPIFRAGNVPKPRPWQKPAMETIIAAHQGIYKAPAGSGKTVTVLAAIQKLGCKSLVIVNTKDILWQWQERVEDFLGSNYPCGQIGDGKFDVSPYITIATAQTIHSRYHDLEQEGFFDEFSFVCLDECHHATADTYNRVLDRFTARYRVGVSATPDKTGDFALATNVLGPIIHTTRPEEVSALLKPEVIRVPTKFGFGFRGTRSRWQRSNYGQMIDSLITDNNRNRLIIDRIMENQGHHQLVVSKRLLHLELIREGLEERGFADPIVTITGQDDNESRQEAKALAEEAPCVVLSTVADEALDIPRLDRLHLPFPQKNSGLVTQQVGRVERVHPDKSDAYIYDYIDGNVGPLEKQARVRRFDVYTPRGYKITTRKTEEPA